jgi:hypothetical protein
MGEVVNRKDGSGKMCNCGLMGKLEQEKGIDAVYDIAYWLMTRAWKVNVRGNNVNVYNALYVKEREIYKERINEDVNSNNNSNNNNNSSNVHMSCNTINVERSISHKDICGKIFQEKQYDELSLQEYLNKEVQELKRSKSQTIFKVNDNNNNNIKHSKIKYQTPNASMRRDYYYNNNNNNDSSNNNNNHSSSNCIFRNPQQRNNNHNPHLNTVSRSFKNINTNFKVVKPNKQNTQYTSFRNTNKLYQTPSNTYYYNTFKTNDNNKYYNVFASTNSISKANKMITSLSTLNSLNLNVNQHRNSMNSFYTPQKMVPSHSKGSMKSFNNIHSLYSTPNTGRDKRNIRKKMYYKYQQEETPIIHRIVIDLREVIKDS